MKKYIYSILALVLFCLVGCNDELGTALNHDGDVRFSIKTTSKTLVRATIEDTPVEERIDWVDVFIFNADKSIFHKERVDVSNAPVYKSGEFTIQKKRDEFAENKHYYVYLVANASQDLTSAESNVTTWNDLQSLVQFDNNMHLSAFVDSEGNPAFANAPARFLMDGFAYIGSTTGAVTPPTEMSTCVINNPDVKELLLCGTLYRAAAKFIINIKQGNSVEFQKSLVNPLDDVSKKPQYYINQLPSSTRVLPPVEGDNFKPSTQNSTPIGLNDHSFTWNNSDNSMIITGYSYADDWSRLEYTKQASILFNIPMKWDKDNLPSNGKEQVCADNWYKIPLSKTKSFNRNTCYIINITVNAVGAEEKEYAVELDNIEYITLPWEKVTMDLGGYGAAFLTLNTDLIKIYDTNIDTDQLTFTSSSHIKSIKLKDTFSHNEQNGIFEQGGTVIGDNGLPTGEYTGTDGLYAYYIDKFGQKIQLGTDPGFDLKVVEQPGWTKDDILAKELNLYKKEGVADNAQYIRAEVWDEHKRALNGNITIHSPILPVEGNEDLNWPSHFNTVRYLEFEVTNEQGITATFRVEHYPLSVITNEEGFYSFRDDHVLTDDPNEKPFDLFNYEPNFNSVMTSSMYLCHPHDFTDEPRPSYEVWARTPEMHLVKPEDFKGEPNDAYWETVQQDRSYSWLKKDDRSYTWLFDPTNTCPSQGSEGETWVEIRYGFYANTITYNNGKNTKTFQGIHRPRIEDRPYSDYFYRDMYRSLPGELAITNSSYKGTGLGPYYKAKVIDKDGNEQTRIFRDHYRWNAQPVFWSKFVHKYYSEPAQGATYNYGTSSKPNYKSAYKQAGQVDMYEYGPSENGGKTWGRYTYSTNLYKFSNHRMYKVFTTASSQDFTLGYPRRTENGETENTPNNSNIVSPTLMLASQLGETNYQQFLNNANYYNYIIPNIKEIYRVAERHCREYVETTFVDEPDPNGVYNHMWDEGEEIIEYRDWRLPTKAEIDAIINFQNSSRAMDKVLDAQYYFCITGTADSDDLTNIHNWVSGEIPGYDSATSQGYYIRCVRDVR